MTSLKALLAGIALAALTVPALLTGTAGAADYKAEYKLSTVLGKPFPWGIGGDRWAELVKEKTNGRINVKMYPGTSLVNGDQTKEFTALRQGTIDMAVGSTINWSPQVKELNLFSLPFLMPDHKALDALTQGQVGKTLFDLLATKDVVPLAWGENGFREISNSKRSIKTPEDLKGLKIRVVGHTDAVGGDAANLALSERRAKAVVAYLVERHHIRPERLEASGRGLRELLLPDQPKAAANRRVEIINLGE